MHFDPPEAPARAPGGAPAQAPEAPDAPLAFEAATPTAISPPTDSILPDEAVAPAAPSAAGSDDHSRADDSPAIGSPANDSAAAAPADDAIGSSADFGLAEPSRRPKCLIRRDLSTEIVDKPVRNPAPVLTLEGRPY